MSVLVAGGAGFIGLSLTESYLRQGESVVVFDINDVHPVALRCFATLPGTLVAIQGDIRDRDAVVRAMRDNNVDRAFYGAALTSGADREHNVPEQVVEVNLLGNINVIKAGEAVGLKRFINISSGAVYGPRGDDASESLDEELSPIDPTSIYAATKFASERIGRRLAELTNIDVRSVRLSGTYGAWEINSGARDTLSPLMQVALQARSAGQAIISRRDNLDWTYSRHVGDALVVLMSTTTLKNNLFHISSEVAFSVLDFCAYMKTVYKDFDYHLAEAGETANIDLHGDGDRIPMSAHRLFEDTGHRLPGDLKTVFADFTQWIDEYPDFWPDE